MQTFNGDKPRSHLFIPDRQTIPGCSNTLDKAIGNFITDRKPDIIVNIGDHADMKSLCSYDYGTKSYEGRQYKDDIEASVNAHEIMFLPLRKLQDYQMINDLPVYQPETFICYGNHEQRIVKTVEIDRKLEGTLSLEDLQYSRFYKHVFPFLEKFQVDGVTYVHYSWKKLPSKAMEGELIARNILNHEMTSISVGHTPEFHYYEKFNGNGKRIQCLVVGSCFEHYEPYAGQRNKQYWRGIVLKTNVIDGTYDFERISIEQLFKNYL